jgi:hypothetical protein
VTPSLAASNLTRIVSDSGNNLNTFLVQRSSFRKKTELTTPVTPDPQFPLSTENLKSSDFASKLEALLQEKIYNVKHDTVHKNPQLYTNNSSVRNIDAKGNVNHHQTVVTTNANEREEDSVKESKVLQSEAEEEHLDRETQLANIKGRLEQFFTNRSDLKVPPSHPKLANVGAKNDEMKRENEDAQSDFKQLSNKLLLNEKETLKVRDENNNFDVTKQRLLMGEVLASLKFVKSRNIADSSEDGSTSNDAGDDEVFEDLKPLSEVTTKVQQ